MIQLERYFEKFENDYWESVSRIINDSMQKEIVESCKKFLPKDFFTCGEDKLFKSLILAPFEKLKEAHAYINNHSFEIMKRECFQEVEEKKYEIKGMYRTIHDSYIPT